MNVLVISEWFYPRGGGAEYATYLLLKELSQYARVVVITGSDIYAKLKGVEFVWVPWLGRDRLRAHVGCYALDKVGKVRELLKWADLVYIPKAAYAFIPRAKLEGVRVLLHTHDFSPVMPHGLYDGNRGNYFVETVKYWRHLGYNLLGSFFVGLTHYLDRELAEYADEILCVSEYQREVVAKFAPKLRGKLRVLYNLPPELPTYRGRRERVAVYAGGGSMAKGFPLALELLRKGVKLIAVGDYSRRQERALRLLGAELVGRVRHGLFLRHLSRSHALFSPSLIAEPLPYTVMESMLVGTLPVTTNSGGVVELVKGTIAEDYSVGPDEVVDKAVEALDVEYDPVELSSKFRERFNRERLVEEAIKVFLG